MKRIRSVSADELKHTLIKYESECKWQKSNLQGNNTSDELLLGWVEWTGRVILKANNIVIACRQAISSGAITALPDVKQWRYLNEGIYLRKTRI